VIKIASLGVIVAGIGGLGLLTAYSEGFAWRLPPIINVASAVKLDVEQEWRVHKCFLETEDTQFAPECAAHGHRPLLFLWGDSFAAALYPGLKNLQRHMEFSIAQYNAAGCPPVLSVAVEARPNCVQDTELTFSALRQAQPDLVLLDALWAWWDSEDFMRRLSQQVAMLNGLKVPRIIIVGPIPAWVGGLPRALVDYHKMHHELIPARSSFRVIPEWFDFQKRFRRQVQKFAEYISLWDLLCDEMECLTRVGERADDLIAFDEAHLTLRGSRYVAEAIAPCLFSDSKVKRTMPTDRANICQ
jgi:hypothetical protein